MTLPLPVDTCAKLDSYMPFMPVDSENCMGWSQIMMGMSNSRECIPPLWCWTCMLIDKSKTWCGDHDWLIKFNCSRDHPQEPSIVPMWKQGFKLPFLKIPKCVPMPKITCRGHHHVMELATTFLAAKRRSHLRNYGTLQFGQRWQLSGMLIWWPRTSLILADTTCGQIQGSKMERGICLSLHEKCQCTTSCSPCPDCSAAPLLDKELDTEWLSVPETFAVCGGLAEDAIVSRWVSFQSNL